MELDEIIEDSEGIGSIEIMPNYLLRSMSNLQPEKRLMLAVLGNAVTQFQKYVVSERRRGKRLLQEAREWFFNQSGGEWLYSFENICEELKLSQDYIRLGLQKYENKKKVLKTSKPAEFQGMLEKATYKKINALTYERHASESGR